MFKAIGFVLCRTQIINSAISGRYNAYLLWLAQPLFENDFFGPSSCISLQPHWRRPGWRL
jgi:hypothetical protein